MEFAELPSMPRHTPLPLALLLACAHPSPPPASDAGGADAAGGATDGGVVFVDTGAGDVGPDGGPASDAGRPDGGSEASIDAGPAAPRFVHSWGGRGTEPGQFIEPSSVALDSAGFVYVAGHENRFQKFTGDGELVAIYGVQGTGDGEFNHPHGLAIDRRRGDLVYVGDQNNNRLQVFTPEGSFEREWGDEFFRHIHDVGIDPDTGELFVGDYELDTLRRFSAAGDLLETYGGTGVGPGEFNGVWGVSTDSRGDVFVADTFNRRVQRLSREGRYLGEWGGYAGAPFVKPTGVFVDAADRVYVCDSLAELVLVFDTEGAPLERWDLAQIVGERTEPEDIVLDAAAEHIYIGEVFGHRVLHLRR